MPAYLRLPEPYDFELSTERYRTFGPDRANLWHEGGLHRVLDGVEVRIEAAPGGVAATAAGGAVPRRRVLAYLGAAFDLDAFADFAQGDPVLARLAAALRGFRPPVSPDPFESLVTSITAQQVSLHSALAIRNRLVERYGVVAHGRAHAFPAREAIAAATEDDLVALGFSRRKAEYVVGLARHPIDLDELAGLDDAEVRVRLTAIRGLGEWTADWYLARHLARPAAWPAGDLGLRKAVASFYGAVNDLRAFGARFHPFQNLAAHYLLTGLRVAPPT